jgi:hypothetical protein
MFQRIFWKNFSQSSESAVFCDQPVQRFDSVVVFVRQRAELRLLFLLDR